MSILNVLISRERLLVAVDTLAEDARTGAVSAGAKLLLFPQHNMIMATRGSAQFFLRIYHELLQRSFSADFNIERAIAEALPLLERLWPDYELAAQRAGIARAAMNTELVLGGWSAAQGRMVATAYAKSADSGRATSQPLIGGLASPGEPLRGLADSFDPTAVLAAGRLQAAYLNKSAGRTVAGGRLLAALLRSGEALVADLGPV